MQLIEAVPNFSEGKSPQKIARLVQAASCVVGARVLHTDSNPDANRSVLTLAGTPQAVVDSAFLLMRQALQEIDMRTHHGAHPRLGAVDVCPLVPVSGISLEETIPWAEQLARRAADELHLPIYLYEANARTEKRKNLAFIRQGEYENLPSKLHFLPPDYGPREFNEQVAKTGASVIGARNFLIAFNMSLSTKDVQTARAIATRLREKDGGLKAVKAIGWYMDAYHCAQVSCNLTNFHQTGLAEVFETCQQLAAAHNVEITAGELIGLLPQEALVQAGKFYASGENNTATLVKVAVEKLKLSQIRPFNAQERILEYQLKTLF
ncbi:MAG: glutamate formimidoyltransferase [Elusimicrobiaceae bacterium]|nr:glutamate formimidoyltransferase [Elusimicrobiaceae bacterium]